MNKFIATLAALSLTLAPAYAAYNVNVVLFGGHGQDGDVTKSGSESAQVLVNAKKFTVSGTWNIKSGSVVNCVSDALITGIINVGTGAKALTFTSAVFNGGPTRGTGIGAGEANGIYGDQYVGGSGGGFGGKGGYGGRSSASSYATVGGGTYTPDLMAGGSSGGSGRYISSPPSGTAGAPGDGGGSFKLYSAAGITISGSGVVHIDGGNGGAGSSASGGGGGSGGYGLFAALKYIVCSATNGCTAKGGNGGGSTSGFGNGAPGGGGYLTFIAPSVSLTGGTDRSAGSAGSGGTDYTAPGSADAGIALSIVAIPTYQIIAAVDSKNKVDDFLAWLGREKDHYVAVNEKTILDYIAWKTNQVIGVPMTLEHDKVRHLGEYHEAA